MSEEFGEFEDASAVIAEMVGSWNVPAGARQANLIRSTILELIDQDEIDEDEGPQIVADLAVGPLVVALGRLEVGLAAALRRIEHLERALADRDR